MRHTFFVGVTLRALSPLGLLEPTPFDAEQLAPVIGTARLIRIMTIGTAADSPVADSPK